MTSNIRVWVPAAGLMLSLAGISWADSTDPATQPASATSRPASEIVLVRVGETVITQEDLNREVGIVRPERAAARVVSSMRALIGQRLLSLYLDEHPELVDADTLNARVQEILDKEGVQTREELEARMAAQGLPGKLEHHVRRLRIMLGREAIVREAEKRAKDDEYMKALWDRNPAEFDGTSMFTRQIRIDKLPWDTPEQLRAKRDKAEKIREDLVSGRRTWDQCVTESDCPSRTVGGDLGYVPRHLEQPEVVGTAIFGLQPGETSDVVEDRSAIYVVQVTRRHQGGLTFEQARPKMNLWIQWEPLHKIDEEMRAKHPIVGVREPEMPAPPASLPAEWLPAPASRPADEGRLGRLRPPATRPG